MKITGTLTSSRYSDSFAAPTWARHLEEIIHTIIQNILPPSHGYPTLHKESSIVRVLVQRWYTPLHLNSTVLVTEVLPSLTEQYTGEAERGMWYYRLSLYIHTLTSLNSLRALLKPHAVGNFFSEVFSPPIFQQKLWTEKWKSLSFFMFSKVK